MDRYLSVRKPAIQTAPYPPRIKPDEDKRRWSKLSVSLTESGKKPSSSATTKHLLNTLSDSCNPITHSNIYERSDTVVSATTGDQRGEGRTPHGISSKAYFEHRSRKLSRQRREEFPKGTVLSNVRIFIDGYLSGTTDIEMKKIITEAGGSILLAPSGATHILTSQQLSRAKTHKILTTKSRNPVHVVKPEWVTDSITAGRRLPESCYGLVKSSSTRDIVDMLKSSGSS